MKKLIFLLILAVALVGVMSAQDAIYPPGVLSLDVAMPGDGTYQVAIFSDTVSADMLFVEQPVGFLAFSDYYLMYVLTEGAQCYSLIKPVKVTGQGVLIPPNKAGFHLRL